MGSGGESHIGRGREARDKEGDGSGDGEQHLESIGINAATKYGAALNLSDARSSRCTCNVAKRTLPLISIRLSETAILSMDHAGATIPEGMAVGMGHEGRESCTRLIDDVRREERRPIGVADRLRDA